MPKTERNLAGNIPVSRSALSIKSIIKDLQELDKSLITKKEFEEMKMELKKLKEENARIKADFEAMEADRMLYYNQYHQNGKELRALKTENKLLKEEIESTKRSSNPEGVLSELNSSMSSPISVTDTESEVPTTSLTMLAITGNNVNVESNVGEAQLLTRKRRLHSDETPELPSKRPPVTTSTSHSVDPPFKCMLCKERFESIDNLQEHFRLLHPVRAFFCRWCPYAGVSGTKLQQHENTHTSNALKYNGTEQAQFCTICDVCFGPGSGLTQHKNKYH